MKKNLEKEGARIAHGERCPFHAWGDQLKKEGWSRAITSKGRCPVHNTQLCFGLWRPKMGVKARAKIEGGLKENWAIWGLMIPARTDQ